MFNMFWDDAFVSNSDLINKNKCLSSHNKELENRIQHLEAQLDAEIRRSCKPSPKNTLHNWRVEFNNGTHDFVSDASINRIGDNDFEFRNKNGENIFFVFKVKSIRKLSSLCQ